MPALDFSLTNKPNYKKRGDYGIRVARPGFDAENCAQNQLLFNSNWPILQITKVIDLNKNPNYSYIYWDLENEQWVENPDTTGLTVNYTISLSNVGISINSLVYSSTAEGYFNSSYVLKYWKFEYKKYYHGLGYVPFFFKSEEVSNIAGKVILTSVDITKDIDYPYTDGPLPLLSTTKDYGISSSSIFGSKVPGLSSDMFSKLVQCVKTTETSRWTISEEKKLCWSPFKNAGEFKEGEINKYEAFSFSAYKCPFFEAQIAGLFIDSPSDSINSDPFNNNLYYTRDLLVPMMPINDSSSLYGSAAAYYNVGQTEDMYNDASMVILRSPMVSPEYEEVII